MTVALFGLHHPEPLPVTGGDGLVVVAGGTVLAGELASAAAVAGWGVRSPGEAAGEVPFLILDCTTGEGPSARSSTRPPAPRCVTSSGRAGSGRTRARASSATRISLPPTMRAVTFQAPFEVAVEDRPSPELQARDDAIVAVEASGICGSDLHIYHGRVRVEPGFTIGHEFVGTVLAAGEDVTRVSVGDRVLGCYHSACGTCFYCLRSAYHKCDHARTFGHGAALGALPGTQAEQALVPNANLTLRRVPAGMPSETALFAGDVMGTGYHAVRESGVRPGDSVAVLGLGPVGLCAVQVAIAAGAAPVIAVDTVAARLEMAAGFGALPVHLTEESPRDVVKAQTEGRGVDVAIDAVGHADALGLAIRLTRSAGTVNAVGVYAERCEVHMGLVWIKAITLRTGQANVIGHVDRVLGMLAAGVLDPRPLVTHHLPLDDAREAYEIYDRREALKIVLTP